jgi:hypothetical protein
MTRDAGHDERLRVEAVRWPWGNIPLFAVLGPPIGGLLFLLTATALLLLDGRPQDAAQSVSGLPGVLVLSYVFGLPSAAATGLLMAVFEHHLVLFWRKLTLAAAAGAMTTEVLVLIVTGPSGQFDEFGDFGFAILGALAAIACTSIRECVRKATMQG